MKIIPAIDIKNEKCVRLYQGAFDKSTEYFEKPEAIAEVFANDGATDLHIVDLDGAQSGKSSQLPLIANIAQQKKLAIQTGGGIRTTEQIEQLLSEGISRVVIGSIAITNPQTFIQWLSQFRPDTIVLACDVNINNKREPLLAFQGWQQQSSISLWTLLDTYLPLGLKNVLCTDIARDGALVGPNFDLYQQCQTRYPEIQWQASGGVKELNDLITLKNMGLYGVIIGKAFYEKQFTYPQAFEALQTC